MVFVRIGNAKRLQFTTMKAENQNDENEQKKTQHSNHSQCHSIDRQPLNAHTHTA